MYTESAEKIGTGCVCLGHALSRHGHVQPTSSTAPMGLQQLNDKVAMIQRAGCVFLDHVLVTIKNFRHQYMFAQSGFCVCGHSIYKLS